MIAKLLPSFGKMSAPTNMMQAAILHSFHHHWVKSPIEKARMRMLKREEWQRLNMLPAWLERRGRHLCTDKNVIFRLRPVVKTWVCYWLILSELLYLPASLVLQLYLAQGKWVFFFLLGNAYMRGLIPCLISSICSPSIYPSISRVIKYELKYNKFITN